jgi:TM2 domain-containing membrane protein YozV
MSNNKTYGFPAIVSFFLPGVGQLIKGHILKGLMIIFIGWTVSALLSWTIIVPFIIWVWNVYDAYNA